MTPTIRTFRARDASSALAAVKNGLGPNALILSTREVSTGLLRRTEIEITASLSAPDPASSAGPSNPAAVAAVQRYAAPPSHSPLADEVLSLRSAMEDVRREMREATDESRQERMIQHPTALSMIERLESRGVDGTLARSCVRAALETGARTEVDLVLALRASLARELVPGRAPWRPERRRMIALVGPTGAGKTTTLAKIAARAILESQIQVALITVDTYRIGASEQIARYGEIMKVPTYVARDRGELLIAMGRCLNADLVLVDTAGRSLSEAVAKQAEMIRSIPAVELQLVLSAATGARELAATAERYRALRPERLIFTKLDEASGPGALLSAATTLHIPVSCVADGQRVPEDLHALTGSEMADLVLGSESDAFAQSAGGR